MISIDDAVQIILDHCPALPRVEVPLLEALGHAMAEAVTANADVPPFPRAMMDGFAVAAADTTASPAVLKVADCLPAGAKAARPLSRGTAAKIMTGAPLPPGADAVQKKEVCRERPDGTVEVMESVSAGANVAAPGSEFQAGGILLETGHVLAPSDLGVLAIFGHSHPAVIRKPDLCLINTGSELVDVDQPISGGKIRNSNLYSIASFYRANGFACDPLGIAPDNPGAIRAALRTTTGYDVILLTGGVSVGEFDLVQEAVRAEGFEIHVESVAIKPGKPMLFARNGRQVLFGLSGNPVSSLVQSARFALPALRKLAGWTHPSPAFLTAALSEPVRHRGDRTAYRPGRLVESGGRLICQPIQDKGSADLFAWRSANCLYVLPVDQPSLVAGQAVQALTLEGITPVRPILPSRI